MSKERPTSTRRQFAKGLGAAGITSLAGCADYLGGNDQRDERPEQDTPENNTPVDNGSQGTEDPSDGVDDDDTPEEDQEQASNYTWEDILESEQEIIDKALDRELKDVVESAKEKETVGESFKYTPESEIFDDAAGGLGYTHGGKYFDVDHFKDANFEDALRDARTIVQMKATKMNGHINISGMSVGLGWTIEELFDEIRDQELRMGDFGSEGHGFWPIVISPGKDPYTLDSNGYFQGKTWEDPMSQRSGKSPITNFSEDKLRSTSFASRYQRMLTRLSDQPGGIGETFVNKSLLIDANKHFSTEDIPYDKMIPAIAVLNYQEAEFEPDKYHMLHADEWEKLPSFKPGEDEFQEYQQEIEDQITTFEDPNEAEKYFFAEEEWEK